MHEYADDTVVFWQTVKHFKPTETLPSIKEDILKQMFWNSGLQTLRPKGLFSVSFHQMEFNRNYKACLTFEQTQLLKFHVKFAKSKSALNLQVFFLPTLVGFFLLFQHFLYIFFILAGWI